MDENLTKDNTEKCWQIKDKEERMKDTNTALASPIVRPPGELSGAREEPASCPGGSRGSGRAHGVSSTHS